MRMNMAWNVGAAVGGVKGAKQYYGTTLQIRRLLDCISGLFCIRCRKLQKKC